MKEFMKKVKWDSVIIAILTIVTGILCVVMPNQVADVLCIVYGASLIAMGVALFVRYFWFGTLLNGYLLMVATLLFTLGLLCILYPNALQSIMTILFGLFIVADSMSTIVDSIYCSRLHVSGWLIMMILSIITAVLGVVVMFSTFDTVMIFAGCSLIIEGVRRLVLTIIYSKKIKMAKKQLLDSNKEIIIEE